MFTDGAAVDDSTLAVQGSNFLVNHLEVVIQQICLEKKVMLKIIGIDYDATSMLPDAIITTEKKVAASVLNILRALTQ